MIKQESWYVKSTEGSLSDRITQNAKQHEALIEELLAENERLKEIVSQRGAGMQLIWDHMSLVEKNNFISFDCLNASEWFDDKGVPK